MSRRLLSLSLAFATLAAAWVLPSVASADLHYDAEVLALEASGELTPPPALVQSIQADLTVIFAEWPWFATIGTHPWTGWVPSRIIVGLTAEAMQQVVAGTYTGMDQLNAQYGPVDTEVHEAGSYLVMQFTPTYNPLLLAQIYAGAESVVYAEASLIFGEAESDIDRLSTTRYRISHGWDCLAGCLYERTWVLDIVGGHTVLVESAGSIPPGGLGGVAAPPAAAQPRSALLPAAPNPFNPTATVPYVLDAAGHVRLEVFDARGRRVTTLVDAWRAEGEHREVLSLPGDGVASGVYVVQLSVGGQAVGTHRIALVR